MACGIKNTPQIYLGVTYNKQPNSYITWLPSSSQNVHVRIVQHELSHMFGAHDASCSQNQPCVMKGSYDGKSLTGYTDIWCDNCKADFERDLYLGRGYYESM